MGRVDGRLLCRGQCMPYLMWRRLIRHGPMAGQALRTFAAVGAKTILSVDGLPFHSTSLHLLC